MAPKSHLQMVLPPKPDVSERLESIEHVLRDVMAQLGAHRAAEKKHEPEPLGPPEPPRVSNLDRLKALLWERTSLLVEDIARELSIKQKTAYRLARAASHEGAGVLMYEPAGNVDRLRLYRPDRVVAEK